MVFVVTYQKMGNGLVVVIDYGFASGGVGMMLVVDLLLWYHVSET